MCFESGGTRSGQSVGVALRRSALWLGSGDRYSVMRPSVMLILNIVYTAASHK